MKDIINASIVFCIMAFLSMFLVTNMFGDNSVTNIVAKDKYVMNNSPLDLLKELIWYSHVVDEHEHKGTHEVTNISLRLYISCSTNAIWHRPVAIEASISCSVTDIVANICNLSGLKYDSGSYGILVSERLYPECLQIIDNEQVVVDKLSRITIPVVDWHSSRIEDVIDCLSDNEMIEVPSDGYYRPTFILQKTNAADSVELSLQGSNAKLYDVLRIITKIAPIKCIIDSSNICFTVCSEHKGTHLPQTPSLPTNPPPAATSTTPDKH